MNSVALEPKALFRKIEALCSDLGATTSPGDFADRVVPRLLESLGSDAGFHSALVYQRRTGKLRLRSSFGVACEDPASELVRAFGPAGSDSDLPWVGATAAGATGLIALESGAALLVALVFAPEAPAPAFLTPLQFALTQQLRRRALEQVVDQAREIQMSLLPPARPRFADFDICAATVPAEVVGGDLYDFIPLDGDTLAIAVADASGHGLPAALQARDVLTGLRMGVERDLRITRTVEKLNHVIHRSGLVTRFISMMFAELEANGNLMYVNAGHPPGWLLDDGGLHELSVGGMLLGPDPASTYKMGFAHLDRGAVLALYTDGVLEQPARDGEPFGDVRLRAWLESWREGPAEPAVTDLLARLREHGGRTGFDDDVSVVFVRRPRGA